MVSTVDAQPVVMAPPKPVRILELVGPAGAGKSTLRQVLTARDKRIAPCDPPYYRRAGDMPFFARNTIRLLPRILQSLHGRDDWRLNRRQIDWLVILQGWQLVLKQRALTTNAIVVLDQGPVHLLAELTSLGPRALQGQSTNAWWDNLYQQWAATLDLVVWLDTADAVLIQRIRTRAKWHGAKDQPEEKICEFLGRYRMAYESVLGRLTARAGGPGLLRADTAQRSPDQLADWLLEAVQRKNGEGGRE